MAEPFEVAKEKRFRRYLREAQSTNNIPLKPAVIRITPINEQVASEAPIVVANEIPEVQQDRELPNRINYKIPERGDTGL